MKKLIKYCLLGGIAILSGCSDDGSDLNKSSEMWENLNTKSAKYIHKLIDGNESVTFELSSFSMYSKESDDNKWHKEDPSEWLGWSMPAPEKINIHQGRSWTPLILFNGTIGPHPLELPLRAYRKATGFDKTYYVASPISLDSKEGILTIGEREYEVEIANSKNLKIRYISSAIKGNGTTVGWRYDLKYNSKTLSLPDTDNILWYETRIDAYLDILQMLREYFGDTVDVNSYFYPGIIYDNGIVDFDEVEKLIYETYNAWID